MTNASNQRLQSKRRLVSSDKRKRALFSCDRCKLRKTKCNRLQNNDLKYDNITPCLQCTKAGVSCTTSIPRKKRFYGPVKNITLHYKCLLALVTGLFPDSDVYSIEDLIDLGHRLKFEMPSLEASNEDMDTKQQESFELLKKEISDETHSDPTESGVENKIKKTTREDGINGFTTAGAPNTDTNKVGQTELLKNKEANKDESCGLHENPIPKTEESDGTSKDVKNLDRTKTKQSNEMPKLPPEVRLRNTNIDSERLIMDKFGHTHFIGNFGTASLLNGLCDIIIKRSYNQKNPPTSTQDIRDSSVQTITSENVPLYHYPKHLYNLDAINVDRFPLINIVEQHEAEVYVKVFFEKVHPYYLIFNEGDFCAKYKVFWEELDATRLQENDNSHTVSRLSSAEICSIYTVWILGRRFQQYSDPGNLPANSVLDEDMIGKLIDIIKLSLSDVVLTPSIDGIRLLILFSVYLSSIKVRESGYCLMELAAIQAKSLGLHRKSIVNKFNDEKSDVMKRILWSLTKAETTLCCSFGRSSAIPWEEIDISLPELRDVTDELFKVYYFQSCKLNKIIFEILDYKKRSQKDPLSLSSIEKALFFKNKIKTFWDSLPSEWHDYKSLPIKRYKPKLHIQYHFYHITLTLPMFLNIVNSHNYIIKNDDPFLSLLVCGIQSSFKTAEIVSYTDSKGLFNGTIYYDVFYCYNAIMVLTLTYILFKSPQPTKAKQIIDLNNLNTQYGINLEQILKSINLIRKLVLNNLHKIDGTMKRMSDIIETLLEDLGIIQTLVQQYNAPPSSVRNIEDKRESGNTSVTSIPTCYRRIKLNLNRDEASKKKRPTKVSNKPPVRSTSTDIASEISKSNKVSNVDGNFSSSKLKRAQSHPIESIPSMLDQNAHSLLSPIPSSSSMFDTMNMHGNGGYLSNIQTNTTKLPVGYNSYPYSIVSPNGEDYAAMDGKREATMTAPTSADINDVLSSMSLDTDLMDALFGTDLFNFDQTTSF